MIGKGLDKKVLLCDAGSFCCDRSCISIFEEYVRDSGWIKEGNLFCHECMTGEVKFDEEGHFKLYKNSQDNLFYCYQASVSIISELKNTIRFTIIRSGIEHQHLKVTHVIHDGTKLNDDLIIKDQFKLRLIIMLKLL